MAVSAAIAIAASAFDLRVNTTVSMPIGLYREVPLRLERGPAELETLLRGLGRRPPDNPSRLVIAVRNALGRSRGRALGSEDRGDP